MKLAVLQCDVQDGKIEENSHKVLEFINMAVDADLCILPGDALTGPSKHGAHVFYDQIGRALHWLAQSLPANAALLGHAREVGYFLIEKNGWRKIDHQFTFGDLRIGVDLAQKDANEIDLGIALKPRVFVPGANDEWELIFSGFCRFNSVWGVSANLAGGYGSDIYAGQSMAMRMDGTLMAKARAFAEDCLLIDLDSPHWTGRIDPGPSSRQEAIWDALTLGLRDFTHKAGFSRVILGLSGGMDSALVAALAVSALGSGNVIGVLLPSPYTSADSIRDASELAQNLGIEALSLPITPMFESFLKALKPAYEKLPRLDDEVSEENLQARIRGVALMALSNYSGAMLLNCGNKSEAAMGYCTLYGDTAGALSVIGDVFKTQVYELAQWFCEKEGSQLIPERIFKKEPTAELRPGQKDTDSLPPYAQLDPMLIELLQNAEARHGSQHLAELYAKVMHASFKRRQSPPVLRVSDLPLDQY